MRPSKLWPVTVALILLLAAGGALEVASATHEIDTQVTRITRNADAMDEDSEEDQRWYAQAPLSDAHRRSRMLALRGDYGGALQGFATVAAEHPGEPLLLAEYGHFLRKSGAHAQALDMLSEAETYLPGNPTILLDRATALTQLHRTEEAAETYRRALEARPQHSLTRVSFGALLRKQSRFEEAIQVLKPAATHGGNEERARALAELGRTQMEAGKVAAARQALSRAVQRAPALAVIWAKVARAYLQSEAPEDLASGLVHAQKALALSPASSSALTLLGRAQEASGHADAALDAYEKALHLEDTRSYALRRALRLRLEAEDFRAARKHAAALLAAFPNDRESPFLAGLVESRAGAYDDARKFYAAAIEKADGNYPEAYYNRGLLERRAGDLRAADECLTKAREQRPRYLAAMRSHSAVLHSLGRAEEAEAVLRTAIEKAPKSSANWLSLGRLLGDLGRKEEAIAATRRASELAPGALPARLQLGIALRRAGRNAEAVQVYQELLTDHPRYARLHYNLAIALKAAGRPSEAAESYRASLQLDPDHQKSLKNLGLLEADAGHHEQARPLLEEALEREPGDDEIRIKLAELHLRRGALPECQHEAALVLAKHPNDSMARGLHDRCKTPTKKD